MQSGKGLEFRSGIFIGLGQISSSSLKTEHFQLANFPRPDRPKMDRFSAKLRKLGLREETIGYDPSKEKWMAWNRERS